MEALGEELFEPGFELHVCICTYIYINMSIYSCLMCLRSLKLKEPEHELESGSSEP